MNAMQESPLVSLKSRLTLAISSLFLMVPLAMAAAQE